MCVQFPTITEGTWHEIDQAFEYLFTGAFVIELGFNMASFWYVACTHIWGSMHMQSACVYPVVSDDDEHVDGSRFKLFWSSSWNIFDFVIVLASLLILHPHKADVPGLSSLGLLKPLRIFRLFKRVRLLHPLDGIDCFSGLPNMVSLLLRQHRSLRLSD